MRTDRRTDMTKLIIAVRNFAKAPKIYTGLLVLKICTQRGVNLWRSHKLWHLTPTVYSFPSLFTLCIFIKFFISKLFFKKNTHDIITIKSSQTNYIPKCFACGHNYHHQRKFTTTKTCCSICKISGFRPEIDENCSLLNYSAASSGNFLPTFRDNLSVPSSG